MDERKSQSAAVVVLAFLVAFLPLLYVLAAGPVHGLIKNGYIPQDSIAAKTAIFIYSPISWSMHYSELAAKVMTWYLELWT